MQSRFLPTGDKIQVPETIEEYGRLFDEVFQSRIRHQRIYNERLQTLMDQVAQADKILQSCLDHAKACIANSATPETSYLNELKKLKLSLKVDPQFAESVEPMNQTLLWIKGAQHLFTLANQINSFRILANTPISQDYIRRMKAYMEDMELILKEHKSIEALSPFSFKQSKPSHLQCGKEFDDYLLRTLRIVKHVKNFASQSTKLVVCYTEFEFVLQDAINISNDYINLVRQLVEFMQNEKQEFQLLESSVLEIPNNQVFIRQLCSLKELFKKLMDSINISDFQQLNEIFQTYTKANPGAILSIVQLRRDLLFVLSEQEDEFEAVLKSYKRSCTQALLDMQQYDDFLERMLAFVSKKRDNRIAKIKRQEELRAYLDYDRKDWQLFLRLSISLTTDYIRDFDRKQLQSQDYYMKELRKLKDSKQEDTYSNKNLLKVLNQLESLFVAHIN